MLGHVKVQRNDPPEHFSTAKFARDVFVGQVAVGTPLRGMSTLQRSP